MSTQLSSILFGLSILSVYLAMSVGLNGTCPCSVNNRLNVGCRRRENRMSNRDLDHYDEARGLYGNCLPQVEANTMTCFKWRTEMCLNADESEEKCKLNPTKGLHMNLSQHDQGQKLTFISPGFNRSHLYNRFFCLYNITLECPDHQAELAATERTISFEDNCGDYLAIYSNSSERNPEERICGNEFLNFKMTLNIHSFIAVLWTNSNIISGRFEIEAKCGEDIVSTTTTTTLNTGGGDEESEEGSGGHFDLNF